MSNLLPAAAYKDVQRGYYARTIAVAALVFIAAAIASLAALLPAYITLKTEAVAIAGEMSAIQGSSVPQAAADRNELSEARMLLSDLSFNAKGSSAAGAVLAALSYRASSISIDRITYAPHKKNGRLVLYGTGQSREAVALFRDALKKETMFTSVSVPIEELAGSAGRFSMTLIGAF